MERRKRRALGYAILASLLIAAVGSVSITIISSIGIKMGAIVLGGSFGLAGLIALAIWLIES